MNYGKFILFLYLGFVVFILGLGYMAMQTEFDLVTPDYYVKELEYQQTIDATQNALPIENQVFVTHDGGLIKIQFPDSVTSSKMKVHFYSPSNAKNDRKYELELPANGLLEFADKSLVKGYYKVKMDWEKEGKAYYMEKDLTLTF